MTTCRPGFRPLHLLMAITALLAGGCGAQSKTPGSDAASQPPAAAARPVARIYRFDEKSAFIADMAAELTVITREFDRLFPEVDAASLPLRRKVVPAIESMRSLSGILYRRLDEARTATAAAWPALTAAFRLDLGRLHEGLEQSRLKVSGPHTH